MIDPIKGWLKITQYDDKCAITVTNLVENMWLSKYPFKQKSQTLKDLNLLVMSSKKPYSV